MGRIKKQSVWGSDVGGPGDDDGRKAAEEAWPAGPFRHPGRQIAMTATMDK